LLEDSIKMAEENQEAPNKEEKSKKKDAKQIKALKSEIAELKALVASLAKSQPNAQPEGNSESKAARKKRVDAIEKKFKYDGKVKPGFGGVPKKPLGKPVNYITIKHPENDELTHAKPPPLPKLNN